MADSGFPDSERNLTDAGRSDIAAQTRILHATNWNLTDIRTSPLKRALQTGQIVQSGLKNLSGQETELLVDERLSPGIDADSVDELLAGYLPNQAALWVFHMPDVAVVASYILGVRDSMVFFPPGTMMALNLSLPQWNRSPMLIWTIQPDYTPDSLKNPLI